MVVANVILLALDILKWIVQKLCIIILNLLHFWLKNHSSIIRGLERGHGKRTHREHFTSHLMNHDSPRVRLAQINWQPACKRRIGTGSKWLTQHQDTTLILSCCTFPSKGTIHFCLVFCPRFLPDRQADQIWTGPRQQGVTLTGRLAASAPSNSQLSSTLSALLWVWVV